MNRKATNNDNTIIHKQWLQVDADWCRDSSRVITQQKTRDTRYICSGWLSKQSINLFTGSFWLQIWWTAVNNGNLHTLTEAQKTVIKKCKKGLIIKWTARSNIFIYIWPFYIDMTHNKSAQRARICSKSTDPDPLFLTLLISAPIQSQNPNANSCWPRVPRVPTKNRGDYSSIFRVIA